MTAIMMTLIFRSSAFVFLVAVGGSSVGALGCHMNEPTSPSGGLDRPVNPPKAHDLGRGHDRTEIDTHYGMYIEDRVRNVCSGPSPSFTFDSSKGAGSDPTMQTLANCMLTGALKGKTIRLVGHTDPRGTEAYNAKLGLERAERVKKYLVGQGVDGVRIETASLGEDNASASTELWPRDRHVQVELVR